MISITGDRIGSMLTEEVNSARRNWDGFLALGIVQIMAGMLAAALAFAANARLGGDARRPAPCCRLRSDRGGDVGTRLERVLAVSVTRGS